MPCQNTSKLQASTSETFENSFYSYFSRVYNRTSKWISQCC